MFATENKGQPHAERKQVNATLSCRLERVSKGDRTMSEQQAVQESKQPVEEGKEKPKTPEVQAKETAMEASTKLSNESVQTAYDHVANKVTENKGSSSAAEFKQYRAELTKDLTDSGQLPELSLEWGRRVQKFDDDNSGGLSKVEVAAHINRPEGVDELTKAMGENFIANIEKHGKVNSATGEKELNSEQILDLMGKASDQHKKAKSMTEAEASAQKSAEVFGTKVGDTGKSLYETVDAFGDGNGSVGREEIQRLRSVEGLTKLDQGQKDFLKKLDEGWDSDPAVKALKGADGNISVKSLKDATGETRRETEAEKAQKESLEAQKAEQDAQKAEELRQKSKAYSDFLNAPGKAGAASIFEAADIEGARKNGKNDQVDGKVNEKDLQALLDKADLYGINDQDKAAIKGIIDNWSSHELIKGLQEDGGWGTGNVITKDSLKAASEKPAEEAEKKEATTEEDPAKVDPEKSAELYQTRREAGVYGKTLLGDSGVADKSILSAADLYGDGDGKVTMDELKALRESPLNLDEDTRAFIEAVEQNWDKPHIQALRQGQDYITEDGAKHFQQYI